MRDEPPPFSDRLRGGRPSDQASASSTDSLPCLRSRTLLLSAARRLRRVSSWWPSVTSASRSQPAQAGSCRRCQLRGRMSGRTGLASDSSSGRNSLPPLLELDLTASVWGGGKLQLEEEAVHIGAIGRFYKLLSEGFGSVLPVSAVTSRADRMAVRLFIRYTARQVLQGGRCSVYMMNLSHAVQCVCLEIIIRVDLVQRILPLAHDAIELLFVDHAVTITVCFIYHFLLSCWVRRLVMKRSTGVHSRRLMAPSWFA